MDVTTDIGEKSASFRITEHSDIIYVHRIGANVKRVSKYNNWWTKPAEVGSARDPDHMRSYYYPGRNHL